MGYINNHIVWLNRSNSTYLRDGEIWIGTIDASAANTVCGDHGAVLLECYIDPSILDATANENGLSAGDFLRTEILPDWPHIKSGDFGEILARSILHERSDCPCFPAYRWRMRAYKNDTIRGIDLLGYVISGENGEYSESDVLVISEVKTRAQTTNAMVVKEAFDDVKKHFISKLANSLYFMQTWLRQQGQSNEANRFARFANPHNLPYRKRLVPCIIHNFDTWDDQFINELPQDHGLSVEVEVIVVCVENLLVWIDSVYEAAIECAGE